MKKAYITTKNGELVAEVDGTIYWETTEVAAMIGFGVTVEVEEFSDGWELADMLEEAADAE